MHELEYDNFKKAPIAAYNVIEISNTMKHHSCILRLWNLKEYECNHNTFEGSFAVLRSFSERRMYPNDQNTDMKAAAIPPAVA